MLFSLYAGFFFYSFDWWVSHWSLGDSKSHQVSRTLFRILVESKLSLLSPVKNIIILFLRVFHTSVSWWFHTGVWMTSRLKFPGLFSVFWLILTTLYSGWSPFVLLFSSLPVLLPILWRLFQEHQSQLVSPLPSSVL